MRYSNEPLEFISSFFREHRLLGKLLALLLLIAALAACWETGKNRGSYADTRVPDAPDTLEELEENFAYLAVTQLDEQTDPAEAETIDLSQYEERCDIREGGSYRLTGELEGSLYISAKEQNVHLFLDNAVITSEFGPAVQCDRADKLVITLLPGTENFISDNGRYHADAEIEACIYSDCDVTFNGTGALTVNGYYKDAIRSRDIVKILDGSYTIKCKRTGIHGNDGVVINGGDFMISSEKYGIKTTKSGPEGRGNLMIGGGELNIIAGRYSVVAVQGNLYIYNCSINHRSIVDFADVSGLRRIQEGCVV